MPGQVARRHSLSTHWVQARPHPSLRWRLFDDALVCFVEAHCETHGLPAALAPLLQGPSLLLPCEEADCFEPLPQGWRLSRPVLDELLQLNILVPAS